MGEMRSGKGRSAIRRFGVGAAACAVVIAFTGCTTDDSGQASPTPGGSGSTAKVTAAPGTASTGSGTGGTGSGTEATGTGGADGGGGGATTVPDSKPPATPEPTPAAGGIWDPCTLPDAELTAAGLNVGSETRLPDPTVPSRRICRWQAADGTYELVAGASERSIDDLLAPGTYQDLRRTEFYGRQVVVYRSVQDTNMLGCYVGTPAAFGSIVFTVRNTTPQKDASQACANANRLAAKLFTSLP